MGSRPKNTFTSDEDLLGVGCVTLASRRCGVRWRRGSWYQRSGSPGPGWGLCLNKLLIGWSTHTRKFRKKVQVGIPMTKHNCVNVGFNDKCPGTWFDCYQISNPGIRLSCESPNFTDFSFELSLHSFLFISTAPVTLYQVISVNSFLQCVY